MLISKPFDIPPLAPLAPFPSRPATPADSHQPPDEFQLIAGGVLREADRISNVFVGSNGFIYREQPKNDFSQPPYEPTPLGYISPNGDYFLFSNRNRGNTLTSKDMSRLAVDFLHTVGTFGTTLRQNWQDMAVRNSEIPWIRQNLTQRGIDGRGVTVGVCEGPLPDSPASEANDAWHARAVSRIVTSPRYGVAPGAQVQFYPFLKAPAAEIFDQVNPTDVLNSPESPLSDKPETLNKRLTTYYTSRYGQSTRELANILNRRSTSLRVLNLSVAFSRGELYTDLNAALQSKTDATHYSYPRLRSLIIGADANVRNVSPLECLQACVRYVDQISNADPEIQQVRLNYQQCTKILAEQGITVVVETGNEHDSLPDLIRTEPGYDFNELAKSPYVISVANSDSNGTPGYLADDQIASASSQGAPGGPWQPTLAAPGSAVRFEPWVGLNGTGASLGTSFSVPYVSATIALMLQEQPQLTFNQIKDRLQKTSTLIAAPYHVTGAGVVNPVQAASGFSSETNSVSLPPSIRHHQVQSSTL